MYLRTRSQVADRPSKLIAVSRFQVSAVEVEGIDLESLHQERVDVLDGELELHRFVRLEELLVVCGEIEIYPVLEGVDRNRGQHGVPLFGIAEASRQLGFCEQRLQVIVPHELDETLVVLVLDEEL